MPNPRHNLESGPGERPARTETRTSGGSGEIAQHFSGTVLKVTADGTRVLSDHLADGERLASDVDAEKADKKAEKSIG